MDKHKLFLYFIGCSSVSFIAGVLICAVSIHISVQTTLSAVQKNEQLEYADSEKTQTQGPFTLKLAPITETGIFLRHASSSRDILLGYNGTSVNGSSDIWNHPGFFTLSTTTNPTVYALEKILPDAAVTPLEKTFVAEDDQYALGRISLRYTIPLVGRFEVKGSGKDAFTPIRLEYERYSEDRKDYRVYEGIRVNGVIRYQPSSAEPEDITCEGECVKGAGELFGVSANLRKVYFSDDVKMFYYEPSSETLMEVDNLPTDLIRL